MFSVKGLWIIPFTGIYCIFATEPTRFVEDTDIYNFIVDNDDIKDNETNANTLFEFISNFEKGTTNSLVNVGRTASSIIAEYNLAITQSDSSISNDEAMSNVFKYALEYIEIKNKYVNLLKNKICNRLNDFKNWNNVVYVKTQTYYKLKHMEYSLRLLEENHFTLKNFQECIKPYKTHSKRLIVELLESMNIIEQDSEFMISLKDLPICVPEISNSIKKINQIGFSIILNSVKNIYPLLKTTASLQDLEPITDDKINLSELDIIYNNYFNKRIQALIDACHLSDKIFKNTFQECHDSCEKIQKIILKMLKSKSIINDQILRMEYLIDLEISDDNLSSLRIKIHEMKKIIEIFQFFIYQYTLLIKTILLVGNERLTDLMNKFNHYYCLIINENRKLINIFSSAAIKISFITDYDDIETNLYKAYTAIHIKHEGISLEFTKNEQITKIDEQNSMIKFVRSKLLVIYNNLIKYTEKLSSQRDASIVFCNTFAMNEKATELTKSALKEQVRILRFLVEYNPTRNKPFEQDKAITNIDDIFSTYIVNLKEAEKNNKNVTKLSLIVLKVNELQLKFGRDNVNYANCNICKRVDQFKMCLKFRKIYNINKIVIKIRNIYCTRLQMDYEKLESINYKLKKSIKDLKNVLISIYVSLYRVKKYELKIRAIGNGLDINIFNDTYNGDDVKHLLNRFCKKLVIILDEQYDKIQSNTREIIKKDRILKENRLTIKIIDIDMASRMINLIYSFFNKVPEFRLLANDFGHDICRIEKGIVIDDCTYLSKSQDVNAYKFFDINHDKKYLQMECNNLDNDILLNQLKLKLFLEPAIFANVFEEAFNHYQDLINNTQDSSINYNSSENEEEILYTTQQQASSDYTLDILKKLLLISNKYIHIDKIEDPVLSKRYYEAYKRILTVRLKLIPFLEATESFSNDASDKKYDILEYLNKLVADVELKIFMHPFFDKVINCDNENVRIENSRVYSNHIQTCMSDIIMQLLQINNVINIYGNISNDYSDKIDQFKNYINIKFKNFVVYLQNNEYFALIELNDRLRTIESPLEPYIDFNKRLTEHIEICESLMNQLRIYVTDKDIYEQTCFIMDDVKNNISCRYLREFEIFQQKKPLLITEKPEKNFQSIINLNNLHMIFKTFLNENHDKMIDRIITEAVYEIFSNFILEQEEAFSTMFKNYQLKQSIGNLEDISLKINEINNIYEHYTNVFKDLDYLLEILKDKDSNFAVISIAERINDATNKTIVTFYAFINEKLKSINITKNFDLYLKCVDACKKLNIFNGNEKEEAYIDFVVNAHVNKLVDLITRFNYLIHEKNKDSYKFDSRYDNYSNDIDNIVDILLQIGAKLQKNNNLYELSQRVHKSMINQYYLFQCINVCKISAIKKLHKNGEIKELQHDIGSYSRMNIVFNELTNELYKSNITGIKFITSTLIKWMEIDNIGHDQLLTTIFNLQKYAWENYSIMTCEAINQIINLLIKNFEQTRSNETLTAIYETARMEKIDHFFYQIYTSYIEDLIKEANGFYDNKIYINYDNSDFKEIINMKTSNFFVLINIFNNDLGQKYKNKIDIMFNCHIKLSKFINNYIDHLNLQYLQEKEGIDIYEEYFNQLKSENVCIENEIKTCNILEYINAFNNIKSGVQLHNNLDIGQEMHNTTINDHYEEEGPTRNYKQEIKTSDQILKGAVDIKDITKETKFNNDKNDSEIITFGKDKTNEQYMAQDLGTIHTKGNNNIDKHDICENETKENGLRRLRFILLIITLLLIGIAIVFYYYKTKT